VKRHAHVLPTAPAHGRCVRKSQLHAHDHQAAVATSHHSSHIIKDEAPKPDAAAARLRADKAALAALAVEQLRQGVAAAQTVQGLQAQLQELRQRLEAAGGSAGAAPSPDAAGARSARSDAADKGSAAPGDDADAAVTTQLRGLKASANELEWGLGEVGSKVDELASDVVGISQDMAEFQERLCDEVTDNADNLQELLDTYSTHLKDGMGAGFPELQEQLVAKMSAELQRSLPGNISRRVLDDIRLPDVARSLQDRFAAATYGLEDQHRQAAEDARYWADKISDTLDDALDNADAFMEDLQQSNRGALQDAQGSVEEEMGGTYSSLMDLGANIEALSAAIADLPTNSSATASSTAKSYDDAVSATKAAVAAIAGQLSSLQASNSARQQALEAAVSALSGQVAGATTSLGDRLDQLSATVAEQGAALAAVAPAAAATAAAGSSTPAGSDQASSAVTLSALGVKLDALLAAHTATAQEVAALRGEVAQLAQAESC